MDGYHPSEIYYQKYFDVPTWCLLQPEHPLAGFAAIRPEDLHGFRVAATDLKLLRLLQTYLEQSSIDTEFEEIPADRYKIMEACAAGSVCFLNEDIAKGFTGFAYVPLAFDCKIESGLACRKESAHAYQLFFEVAGGA